MSKSRNLNFANSTTYPIAAFFLVAHLVSRHVREDMWGIASLVSLVSLVSLEHHARNLPTCAICNITRKLFGDVIMSVGPSGRIVVEVEPELKRELHSALVKDGQTLKDWFVDQATKFVEGRRQLPLALNPRVASDNSATVTDRTKT